MKVLIWIDHGCIDVYDVNTIVGIERVRQMVYDTVRGDYPHESGYNEIPSMSLSNLLDWVQDNCIESDDECFEKFEVHAIRS